MFQVALTRKSSATVSSKAPEKCSRRGSSSVGGCGDGAVVVKMVVIDKCFFMVVN